MRTSVRLRAGEWVQVRSKEEILQTLDQHGQLEGLPFMPEMFELCGLRFRVFKRAHKTCDPPNGMDGRRMLRAVHLEEVRCNGGFHGGCQARCLVFWKESWLRRVEGGAQDVLDVRQKPPSTGNRCEVHNGCTERDVLAGTYAQTGQANSDDPVFVCQSTQMSQATQPLRRWDLRQYVEDYTSGNVRLSQLLVTFLVFLCGQLASAGIGLGSAVRWAYETIQRMKEGISYPWRLGQIRPGSKTPSARLNVQRGDLVRVRSHEEILATIDENGRNRGMSFDPEMVPFCGGTYRVLDRVSKIINEKTGKMQYLKNDCIMLDRVVCGARYAKYRRFCPRSIYPYWREIWLERVDPKL